VVAKVSVDVPRVATGGWRHSVRRGRLRPDLSAAELLLFGDGE
jgi:hypothetical protein